jgi:hypothetical protein
MALPGIYANGELMRVLHAPNYMQFSVFFTMICKSLSNIAFFRNKNREIGNMMQNIQKI